MIAAPMSPLVAAAIAAIAAGLPDRGIFPDLDGAVGLEPASAPPPERAWLRVDRRHHVVTLYDGADALKAWPLIAPPPDAPADPRLPAGVALRAADADEYARLAAPATRAIAAAPSPSEDRDGDGIVDRLDVLLGGKKLLHNRARYLEHYRAIKYPGGDVPRDEGVCTDTVVRALRNAGIDLQQEIHDDIAAAPRAYPMVEKVDPNIDHRRVRTMLPWFRRHWTRLPEAARYLPGDVVFFDTFPRKPGPDHIGVVSDRLAASGLPSVINNWTVGTVEAEMDLLGFVPVTDRFRPPAPSPPR